MVDILNLKKKGKKGLIKVKENTDPSECKDSPAGHLIEAGGKEICVFTYDKDRSPMEDVEVDVLGDGRVQISDRNGT